jgi:hypothetical protein
VPVVAVERPLRHSSHDGMGTAAHSYGPQLLAWIRGFFPSARTIGEDIETGRKMDELMGDGGQAQ